MNAVTVCVPVYNAAAFLAGTLDSITAQTFTDFKVLISLDRGDDDSEAICRRYLADRRFELIVQPRRLGWVGNVNALIDRRVHLSLKQSQAAKRIGWDTQANRAGNGHQIRVHAMRVDRAVLGVFG